MARARWEKDVAVTMLRPGDRLGRGGSEVTEDGWDRLEVVAGPWWVEIG